MGPVKAYPPNFTTWDKFEITGPCTLQELIDRFKTEHNLNMQKLTLREKSIILYNEFWPRVRHADRLTKTPEVLYEEITGQIIPPG